MKDIFRYGFILALICTGASGLLAGVNVLTRPKILAQARLEEEASLKEVMPQGVRFAAVKAAEETLYYQAYDHEDKLVGVVFKTAAKGYSSTIQTMTAMTKDGEIKAIKILEQNETPGLGMRITESEFKQQFKNKKNLEEVSAISGATISSQAVIDSVKKKSAEIKELFKDGK